MRARQQQHSASGSGRCGRRAQQQRYPASGSGRCGWCVKAIARSRLGRRSERTEVSKELECCVQRCRFRRRGCLHPGRSKRRISDESLPEDYKELFLYRWQLAAVELSEKHLRADLTLPLDPRHEEANKVWSDVDLAVKLPTWHCRFRDCKYNSDNEGCQIQPNPALGVWRLLSNTASPGGGLCDDTTTRGHTADM